MGGRCAPERKAWPLALLAALVLGCGTEPGTVVEPGNRPGVALEGYWFTCEEYDDEPGRNADCLLVDDGIEFTGGGTAYALGGGRAYARLRYGDTAHRGAFRIDHDSLALVRTDTFAFAVSGDTLRIDWDDPEPGHAENRDPFTLSGDLLEVRMEPGETRRLRRYRGKTRILSREEYLALFPVP